jgi:hypothetical protein
MTKTFYCGNFTFKGYFIKAGTGWEIGYKFNNKNYFVSNFVSQAEATKWWTMSQKYMTTFCKTEYFPNMNVAFFGTFMGNYLYTQYYSFLKGVISKNYSYSSKVYKKDFAQYKKFKGAYHAA